MKFTNADRILVTSSNNSLNEMQNHNNNNNNNNMMMKNHNALAAAFGTQLHQLHLQSKLQSISPIPFHNNNNNNSTISSMHMKGVAAGNLSMNSIANLSSSSSNTPTSTTNTLFCEQVTTVTNLFEKWNDCERTVVMYALLKRLRYPALKFLQYSIDNNLTQNIGSQSNLSTVVVDINANNASYLQNLLNSYKTLQPGDILDSISTSSSDKDSMPCYGSDFQITTSTQCDERKIYARKEDILHEVLNMLPLLKPGNDEAKLIYLSLIPVAVKDTMQHIVSAELVQQIFSYLLIHPAISSEDRRSVNVWLHHLEDHMQATASGLSNQSYFLQPSPRLSAEHLSGTMSTSGSSNMSSSSSSSSAVSCSSTSNVSMASSSLGNLASNSCSSSSQSSANSTRDWQTIAPPSKQHHLQQQQQQQQLQHKAPPAHTLPDWSSIAAPLVKTSSGSSSSNSSGSLNGSINHHQHCDNLNGITLNELASSQNSLGLSIVGTGGLADNSSSMLVNGVAAAANVAGSATGVGLFGGGNNNTIMSLIGNGGNSNNNNNSNKNNSNINNGNNNNLNASDETDNSFSKNGTDMDFEPSSGSSGLGSIQDGLNYSSNSNHQPQQQQLPSISAFLMGNLNDQFGDNRWSLDGKLAVLKTRRSNSLTTQTLSSGSSSSNSSVITVNDNCSNSTENLAQFANKPRSYSLSIEHQRSGGSLANSGSDTRLDEFRPNYIRFQTNNIGMSNIGLWLKSLRLHKYIELFKNMTYEEMLEISEEFLQGLGVTRGASHKLALCIDKLKDRVNVLTKMEQDIQSGQMMISAVVEELANLVFTPMKPIDSIAPNSGEENVGVHFLRVIDQVGNILQKDCHSDDESLSVFVWILDRSMNSEAFINHITQIRELKVKISKIKMSKMHHGKGGNGGGGGCASNLIKPRWNLKSRKSDSKNGSNDRINYRKNSNDMLNCSVNGMPVMPYPHHLFASPMDYNVGYVHHQHQHQQQQQQQHQQKQQQQPQYKSSSYPNFMNSQHSQQKQQQQHHQQQNAQQQQQQQQMQQHMQQQSHFGSLQQQQQQTPPSQQQQQQQQQHRRSLNNLIVVSGGPQQAQKMIFKPGQGMIATTATTTTTTIDNQMQMVDTLSPQRSHQQQQHQHQQTHSQTQQRRKQSLNGLSTVAPNDACHPQQQQQQQPLQHQQQQPLQHQQQQQQQPKKSMASVVMVSNNEELQQQQQQSRIVGVPNTITTSSSPPQILINNNNNNNILNNNLISQQQLQLLAAAAAAAGNNLAAVNTKNNCLCSNVVSNGVNGVNGGGGVGGSSGVINNSNNNNNNNSIINKNNINNDNNPCIGNCNCCLTTKTNAPSVVTTAAAAAASTTLSTNNSEQPQTQIQIQTQLLLQPQPPQLIANMNSSSSCSNNSLILNDKYQPMTTVSSVSAALNAINDYKSLEQLETLCLQMTEQAIN